MQTDRTLGAAPLPPPTKRGATLTAGLHWLQGTCVRPVYDVLLILKEHMGDEDFADMEHGAWGYSQGFIGAAGVRVFHSPGRSDVCVVVPGRACELLGSELVAAIWEALGMKATRVDVAIDGAPFTPGQLKEAWNTGNVRTVAHRESWDWRENEGGTTFAIGSRQSQRYLRVYDRRETGTRVELELKEERAQEFLRTWRVKGAEALGEVAMGHVKDYVAFVDASADTNISRAPFLTWWEAFVGAVARIRVQLEGRAAPTMDRAQRWLQGQVAPMLATVFEGVWGGDMAYLVRLIKDGKHRRNAKHRRLLAMIGREGPAPAVV